MYVYVFFLFKLYLSAIVCNEIILIVLVHDDVSGGGSWIAWVGSLRL